jgi:diguanylate cyclase (GGDEF)-like protein/PAS domain S-box-containing protein
MTASVPHASASRLAQVAAWLHRVVAWFGLTRVPADADAPVHRRVRVAMYAVLGVVGAVSAWQTWQLEKSEALRVADAEIIRLAAAQGTLAQRMGMLAAQLMSVGDAGEEIGNALGETIVQAQEQAVQLDGLLARQGVWQTTAHPQLRQTVFEWQDRRERIWYRAQILLWLDNRNEADTRLEASRFLQAEVEPFLLTAQVLVQEMQQAAQQRARSAIQQVELSAVATLLVLLALTLLVAEPLARFVRRQHRALSKQSDAMKRLALVAERTANWVAVVDPQRNVLWCNQAFLRGKGCSFDEVQGRHAALLQTNEHNDAAEMQRLLAELDQGRAVRAEIMYRGQQGNEVWLDLEYQPIHDAKGGLEGFTLVATEITERVNQQLRMRSLLDALPVGVVLQSPDGRVLECNQTASELLGLKQQDLVGFGSLARAAMAVREDLSPYPVEERPSSRTLRTGQGLRGESIGLLMPQGEVRWLLTNTEPVHDAAGHLTGVISCTVDVTEQRAQQKLLTLAVESASLGIWQWDIASGAMSCNDRMLTLLGYQPGEVAMTSQAWNELIHPDDLAGWLWAVRTNLRDSTRPLHWEIRIRHGDGRWVWLMYSGTVVARDAAGRAVRMAGITYDINAQKELEEQLRHAARTDHLTHLPNRSELLGRIQSCMQRARQHPGYHFAVLFMDFDRFKQVNDTLGHGVGDELLRQIALRLQDSLRPGDAFVQTSDFKQMAARIGGDEFVVLLDDIRGDLDAQVVAGRLLDVLAQPYQIGVHRLTSSASIGIVTDEHAGEDADSVLRDADIAMYEAKREGRGRYVMFEPSMRKRVRDDVALENDLRQALDKDELFVVYQPVLHLGSGRLSGLEALVRWRHPQRGLVSPLTFIPVAEASGLIGQIGHFVLRAACTEFVQLQAELGGQAPMTLAVNLSRAQLRDAGLVVELQEVLRDCGMPPGQLVLEVTESLAAQDEMVQGTLREIRALGVGLSLDDFGTGYSSLSCLHELPVNIVKIDRSFVGMAMNSDYHRVMIEATIRMAQTLGLSTVAEGIETAEQATLMQALGCAKGQGYLYSVPLDPDALRRWISLRQPRG